MAKDVTFLSAYRKRDGSKLGGRPEIPNTHPLLEHRLATARNGYLQCPVIEKEGRKGWSTMPCSEHDIRTHKDFRDTYFTGTGIRLSHDLTVADIDVSIPHIADEIRADIESLDVEAWDKAIHRDSGAASSAHFFRSEPFTHRRTPRYTAHPEYLPEWEAASKLPETNTEDHKHKKQVQREIMIRLDPQKFEVYGGLSKGRQFQYEGRHSEKDGVVRDYHCQKHAPWNTRRVDPPSLAMAPGPLTDRVQKILEKHLTLIPEPENAGGPEVYDLTPETLFFPKNGEAGTVKELTDSLDMGGENGIPGLLPAHASLRGDHCKLFVTAPGGKIRVIDWSNNGQKHYLISDKQEHVELNDEAKAILAEIAALQEGFDSIGKPRRVEFKDLVGHAPSAKFIHRATLERWPATTVDKRLPKVTVSKTEKGKSVKIPASTWLMQNNAVEQVSWLPGFDEIVADMIVLEGGLLSSPGHRIYNLYRGPRNLDGDAAQAGRWVDHVRLVFAEPGDADHIVRYLAHTAQWPGVKINHGLLLGGPPGVGKDSILTPLRATLGAWNFEDISPRELFGEFNKYQRSVLLRINELHDLGGEGTMFSLYERLKGVTAEPPEMVRINEKNQGEYYIQNINKTVMTTNHKANSIYLPADDRRTYVAWSSLQKAPPEAYFIDLHDWFEDGGSGHVAAYLYSLDLTGFDAKAPPVKTAAFWSIVNANRSAEETGIGDILTAMAHENGAEPDIVTVGDLSAFALKTSMLEVVNWLQDPKHRRHIPSTLERLKYDEVPNPDVIDGRWFLRGRKQSIYGRRELPKAVLLSAIHARIDEEAESMKKLRVLKGGKDDSDRS